MTLAFFGETRMHEFVRIARANDIGLVVQRGRVGKANIDRWVRWIHDNRAYDDWRAGRAFERRVWFADLRAIINLPIEKQPVFAVLPDRVAAGLNSLRLSLRYLAALHRIGVRLRWALAVQDGMTPADLPTELPDVTTIFVGGTANWKWQTAKTWTVAARTRGLKCHVGRVGSPKLIQRAVDAGVDSVDTAQPLWSRENLHAWIASLHHQDKQLRWDV